MSRNSLLKSNLNRAYKSFLPSLYHYLMTSPPIDLVILAGSKFKEIYDSHSAEDSCVTKLENELAQMISDFDSQEPRPSGKVLLVGFNKFQYYKSMAVKAAEVRNQSYWDYMDSMTDSEKYGS